MKYIPTQLGTEWFYDDVPQFYGQKYRPEVFYRKGILKNLAKFRAKHLCRSLLFNEVADLRLKEGTLTKVLSYELCKIFQNTFFVEHPPVAVSDKTSAKFQLSFFNFRVHFMRTWSNLVTLFSKQISFHFCFNQVITDDKRINIS